MTGQGKVRRPRPAATEGRWVRNFFALMALTCIILTVLVFVSGKLPELEHKIANALRTADGTEKEALSARVSLGSDANLRIEPNLAQENLRASTIENQVQITNEGETPIHLVRMVLNKHYGVARCDTNATVGINDSGRLATFTNRVDEILQIGDIYRSISQPECGTAAIVEVFTDQGNAVFKVSPRAQTN
jgi:hypothetical protein